MVGPFLTPLLFCVCGNYFSIIHALSCPRGGFPSIRHNKICNLTAHLLTEICNDALVEPHLQPVSAGNSLVGASANILEGAHLYVAMNGFWGRRYDRTFVDVRVFNPHADSNKTLSLSSTYLKHKSEKCRMYEQRVREVERASFVPIVLSATRGIGKQASVFYKRLASLLYEKGKLPIVPQWTGCTARSPSPCYVQLSNAFVKLILPSTDLTMELTWTMSFPFKINFFHCLTLFSLPCIILQNCFDFEKK